MKKVLFLIIFHCLASFAFGQKDVEFWFAAPSMYKDTIIVPNVENEPQRLRITPVGSSPKTECRIFYPGGSKFPDYKNVIDFGDTWIFDLNLSYSYDVSGPNSSTEEGGICIKCSDSVNVFYEVGVEANADIYPLKGGNAIGRNFIIPWHNRYSNDTVRTGAFEYNPPIPPRNRIDVVVIGEPPGSTVKVDVTPSVDIYAYPGAAGATGNYYPAGFTYTFHPAPGHRLNIIAKDYAAGAHLGGTTISANRQIAVTVSDDRVENDNPKTTNVIGDQLIPVENLGKSYIAVKGGLLNDAAKEELYIVATDGEKSTTIYLHGTDSLTTLQKGQMYTMSFPAGKDAMYFKASSPISVFQNTGIKDYLAGAQLPPIPCFGYKSVGYNRTNEDTLVFSIYVEKRGRGTFAFNGDSTIIKDTDFTLVPGTDTLWYYARIGIPNSLLPKDSTVILSNDILFHLAILEGGDVRKDARYGFLTKYDQLLTYNMISNKTVLCEGDTLRFWLEDYYNLKNIVWTGPNELEEHLDSLVLYNVDTTQRGKYNVTAETINLCDIGEDQDKNILIFDYPVFDLGLDRSHCEGEITFDISKDSVAGFIYKWSTGNDSTASQTVNAPGEYSVEVSNGGCITRDTVTVTPKFTPTLSILSSGDLCEDMGVVLEAQSTAPNYFWDPGAISTPAQYQWKTGDRTQQTTARDTGWHWVRVNYFSNCYAMDSVRIEPRVPILQISERGHLCDKGDTLTAEGDGWTFKWNTSLADTSKSLVANYPGIYWVTSYINFCESTDTIEVMEVIPDVEILQTGGELCRNGITLDATSEYPGTKFEWNTPDRAKTMVANDPGMYYVKVYMNNCVNSDTIEIQEVIPWVSLVKSGDLCRTGITLDATSEYPGTDFKWNVPEGNGKKELHTYKYGTYYVEVFMNNCVNRDTIEISEETFPLSIDTIGDICKGTLVLRADTEGDRFLWNTPERDTTRQITTKDFGLYWVEAYLNGCVNRDSIQIEKQMPDLEITKTKELCRDGYVVLEAVTDASIYEWSTGEDTRQITVDTMGIYSVQVQMNNCVNSDSIDIQEQGPTLRILQEGDLCKNRLLTLKADSDAWEFLWSTGERTKEINITKPGTYWVVVNINSCYNNDTVKFDIKQPIADIVYDKTDGCEPLEISFKNNSTDAVSYLWDFGDGKTSSSEDVKYTYKSGLYRLAFMAYTSEGCMDSVMLNVQAFSAPKPDFYWEPIYSNIKDPGIQFINKTVSGSNENTYIWKFQTNKNDPNAIEIVEDSIDAYYTWKPSGDNLTQGKYKVELVAASVNEGLSGEIHYCYDSISYDIRVLNDFLQFPNVVTPNGDGINDVFKITSLIEGLAFPTNELQIYDRAGRRIYQKKNIKIESDFWDPKSTNTPPGTYIYHFVGKGFSRDVEYSGTVEVLVK